MDNQIINDWLKTYLIGAMEKTKANDEGRGWRDKIRPELEKRRDVNGNPIYVPEDYRIDNTSHRVVKLIIGTYKISHLWDNIRLNNLT